MKKANFKKEKCEICDDSRSEVLDYHHIIPRSDPRCTDDIHNLAIICATCHRAVHAGLFIIEGVYMTTGGRRLFWYRPGEDWVVRPGVFLNDDGTATIVEE